MHRRYMTLKQLAEYLGLAEQTLRNWKSNSPEKLPPHIDLSFGGKRDVWRFDSEVVDEWLHNLNSRQGSKPLFFEIAQ